MILSNETPRTLRLYNTSQGMQLNLNLNLTAQKTALRLRRGSQMRNVTIPPGRFLDVCAELNVSFEEALRIVSNSPDVSRYRKSAMILQREHPPFPERLEKEQAEQARHAAAVAELAATQPPDPPNAINAGVDIAAAGFTPETAPPRKTASPYAATNAPEVLPEAQESDGVGEALISALKAVAGAAPPQVEEDAAEEPTVRTGTPDASWTFSELTQYAEAHRIEVTQTRSKSRMLKKIQEAQQAGNAGGA